MTTLFLQCDRLSLTVLHVQPASALELQIDREGDHAVRVVDNLTDQVGEFWGSETQALNLVTAFITCVALGDERFSALGLDKLWSKAFPHPDFNP